jgi:serine/threonine-protein kinase
MQDASPEMLSLFFAVLERSSADERAAYLDAACGKDVELRARLEALLRAHEQAGGFLRGDSGATDAGATVDEPGSEGPGTVIGPYKLMEQIGEGGMGLVFVAEQQHPVRRKVALKVIKPGMDTRQVVARFEAERQALALMDHPNIAKVLDGGETAGRRPYFVMELVKGVPITQHCDDHRLTPRERLGLFVPVCEAVQHAHQKGIIHRDIKPSNVLVASHDGKPVVRVIDFGVAKAVGQRLTEKTVNTGFVQMIGTPLYMSPEQAGMSGPDVDTRSDIYSLGVLLYELLTGTTPFDRDRLKDVNYDELRRIIREEEPPKPSTRISTLGQAATTVSTNRKCDPKRLSQLCRGELDWVVTKALDKDCNRRYESASAFAADVQRYLRDEPVQACPPSAAYRFRKFARRNKTRLALAGVVVFCVVMLGAGVGWAIRGRALRRAEIAIRVEAALEDVKMFRANGKWAEALQATRRAEDLLAGAEGADQPRQQVKDLLADLAMVMDMEEVRIEQSAVKADHFDAAAADKAYARRFRDYGIDVEVLDIDEAAERIAARSIRVELVAALDNWVHALRVTGREGDGKWQKLLAVAQAADTDFPRNQLREAIARRDQRALRELAASGPALDFPIPTLLLLDAALAGLGDVEQAVSLLRRARWRHPGDFWINQALGSRLKEVPAPRWDEALPFFLAAVALRPESPGAYFNLGQAYRNNGRLDDAITAYREATRLKPDYAEAYFSLGIALGKKGAVDEAITAYREAIQHNPDHADAYSNLGVALREKGALDDAIAAHWKAVNLNPQDAMSHYNLGNALDDRGDREGAIAAFQRAIDRKQDYALAHNNLGYVLLRKGAVDDAIASFQRAIKHNPDYALAYLNLGDALSVKALSVKACLDDAIAAYRKASGIEPQNAKAHCVLGLALRRKGHFADALASLKRGHDLGSPRPGWDLPSAEWLRQTERMVELDAKLPKVLRGEIKPADAGEGVELALLCQRHKGLYAAAVRLYADAFAAQPALAEKLGVPGSRYDAACAAAQAACGQGKDDDKLNAMERTGLRRRALTWLQADMVGWGEVLKKEPDKARLAVRHAMEQRQQAGDFGTVRGPDALAKLPEAERQEWQKLWNDVEVLRRRAAGSEAPAARQQP